MSTGPRLVLRRLLAFAVLLAMLGPASAAIELHYDPQPPPELPKRRLLNDASRPAGAPSSRQIEVARIQDGAEEALYVAARALSLSHAAYGAADPRLIVPRINHAYAQLWSGRAVDAVRAFQTILDGNEGKRRATEPQMLEVWYGLGSAQHAAGLHVSAAESFAKALNVHRRGTGLYRPDQLDILAALAMAEYKAGDLRTAETWQKRRIDVARRSAGQDGARAARSLTAVGRWYRELGRLREATDLHDQALDLKARTFGPQSPEVVSALLDLALSFGRIERGKVNGRPAPATAQDRAMDHAMRIVGGDNALPDAERARLTLLVADTNWVLGRRPQALNAYRTVLSADKPGEPLAARATPPDFLVFDPPPALDLGRSASEQIVATFTVDARGRARDIRLSTGESTSLAQQLMRALKAASLRPALQDGKPVAVQDVRYRLKPDRLSQARAGL